MLGTFYKWFISKGEGAPAQTPPASPGAARRTRDDDVFLRLAPAANDAPPGCSWRGWCGGGVGALAAGADAAGDARLVLAPPAPPCASSTRAAGAPSARSGNNHTQSRDAWSNPTIYIMYSSEINSHNLSDLRQIIEG
ncbi:hypothetical protein MSG28_011231 [Choristoneura fumiferana]|uniref:Uncharacterized protein n=1 Tax=Choristoneura fumiferana TaxID=7141 RepID=A0ACC0KRD6_CHOFU|nr:hypothetical protein MSG28_011231 [Choristoneura fumiferana]